MAISFITSATGTNSATITGIQSGDVVLAYAFRSGSNSTPTLPAGWTQLNTVTSNSSGSLSAWKIASSTSLASGTFTNANNLVLVAYRGCNATTPVGGHAVSTGSSTTVTYPTLTMSVGSGSSWVVGLGGTRGTTSSIATAPTGMTHEAGHVATGEISANDTNGGVTSWSATNESIGGSSTGWGCYSIELLVANSPPSAPTLSSPTNAGTVGTTTPTLQWSDTDPDSDAISYEAQVDTVNTFDSNHPTPTLVQSAQYAGTAAQTNMTFTLGTTPTVGNLLFFIPCFYTGDDPVLTPSGWTRQINYEPNSAGITVFTRVVQSGDTTSWNLNVLTTADQNSGFLFEISGASATNPINSSGVSTSTSTPTTLATDSVTPSVISTLAIAAFVNDGSGGTDTATITSGWTKKQYANSTFQPAWLFTKNALTSDTTTAISATISSMNGGGTDGSSMILLIAPVTPTPLIDALSASGGHDAADFTDVTNGAHTDPFVSGDSVSLTVPAGEALTNGNTYYWRVRGIDPAGSNTYGSWSATDSFTVSTGTVLTKTQSSVARIAVNLTKTQSATARIQTTITKTQAAVARIAENFTKTQSAVSRVANSFTKTQSATARVQRNLTKTQPVTARIQRNLTKTQPATGRVQVSLTKTQSSTARVANNLTLTQSATAHITTSASNTKTQPATSRIAVNLTKTQPTVARIAQPLTKAQSGISRVAVNRSSNDGFGLQFDGSQNYVTVPDNSSLIPTTYTIKAYVTLNSLADGTIIEKYGASSDGYSMGVASGSLYFKVGTVTGTWAIDSTYVNRLVVVQGIWNGSHVKLFVDGVGRANIVGGGTASTSANVGIGAPSPAGFGSTFFDGTIDDITITNQATGVVTAHFGFEEGSGSTTADTIAGNVGTLHGTPLPSWVTSTWRLTAIARIAVGLAKTQSAVTRIQVALSATQLATANIIQSGIVNKTQTAVARIQRNMTATQSGVARIANNKTHTQSATARIQNSKTLTQSALARIAKNLTKTQPATSRIATNSTKTQSSTARIQRNLTKTQSALARIVQPLTKTQTALGRIAVTPTLTQPSVARIQQSPTKTQTAVARLSSSLTLTQPAVAKIINASVVTKTQAATSRIEVTITATQSAKATISPVLRAKTQPAKASILTNVSKKQSTIFLIDGHLAVRLGGTTYLPL